MAACGRHAPWGMLRGRARNTRKEGTARRNGRCQEGCGFALHGRERRGGEDRRHALRQHSGVVGDPPQDDRTLRQGDDPGAVRRGGPRSGHLPDGHPEHRRCGEGSLHRSAVPAAEILQARLLHHSRRRCHRAESGHALPGGGLHGAGLLRHQLRQRAALPDLPEGGSARAGEHDREGRRIAAAAGEDDAGSRGRFGGFRARSGIQRPDGRQGGPQADRDLQPAVCLRRGRDELRDGEAPVRHQERHSGSGDDRQRLDHLGL